jgi:hypothetical protein
MDREIITRKNISAGIRGFYSEPLSFIVMAKALSRITVSIPPLRAVLPFKVRYLNRF